jgi:cytochrome c oxidase assembly factor CtaG
VIENEWNADPVVLLAGTVAVVLYARAFRLLRRRGGPARAPVGNAVLFLVGVAVGVLAVVSPLDALAENTLLSAHMAQHLALGDVAPLLITLGLRGAVSFFVLPPRVLVGIARTPVLRGCLSFLLRPLVSLGVWALALAVWHVPQLYDAALAHPGLHAVEHATLVLGGILLWAQIVDPARRRRLTAGRRAALAVTALVAGLVLSEVLTGSAPLYAHYATAVDRPFGLTWATDQTRAGLLMMTEQLATLGPAAALLLWSHVGRVERALRATEAPH